MMADFDELDFIVENNNVDFEPYHALEERINNVYLELKAERAQLDEEMTDFAEETLLALRQKYF